MLVHDSFLPPPLMKSVLPLTCFHLCFNSCDCSFAGGAVDRCYTVGQERHAGFPREHPCEHTWHRALLLHVPQHQRDLQTDGAASQHRHETAAGQRELRRWPLSPQTRQDPEKRLCAQEVSRPFTDESWISLYKQSTCHNCLVLFCDFVLSPVSGT